MWGVACRLRGPSNKAEYLNALRLIALAQEIPFELLTSNDGAKRKSIRLSIAAEQQEVLRQYHLLGRHVDLLKTKMQDYICTEPRQKRLIRLINYRSRVIDGLEGAGRSDLAAKQRARMEEFLEEITEAVKP